MPPVTTLDGLSGLPQGKPWAIALSGGPDSLALLWLLLQQKPKDLALHAFIVDHGLRAEATAEALQVANTARAFGAIPHILTWRGDKPTAGIQAAAREARHALLQQAMRATGCGVLFFAHHLDDQVETVALRVRKKSGPLGLAGMPALFTRSGILCARPLLRRWRKADLLDLCHAQNLPYVTDPSNSNTAYARVGVRQELAAAPALWAEMAALATQAAHDRQAHILAAQDAERAGHYILKRDALYVQLVAPDKLFAQTIQFLLTLIGQKPYFVDKAQMAALQEWLTSGQSIGTALGGCRLIRNKDGVLLVREVGEIVRETPPPALPFLWDKRFWITEAAGPVVPLGEISWRSTASDTLRDVLEKLPAAVRKTMPVAQQQNGQVTAVTAAACPAFNPLTEGFIVPA